MAERALTAGEIQLAFSMYGNLIDYSQVRIHNNKFVAGQGNNSAVTPNGEIYYAPNIHSNDFSQAGWNDKALFIHEMAHVLQHQNGMNVMAQRAWETVSRINSYNYDSIFSGTLFHELPMEAQAEFMEDVFLKRNGQPVQQNKSGELLVNPLRPLSEYEDVLPMDLPNSTGEELLQYPQQPNFPMPPLALPEDQLLPPWMDDVLEDWGDSKNLGSPLVLDLDGNGIDLASVLSSGAVYWDIDEDGFSEASGWISGNDGLLAIDLNNDGIINDHSELFGSLNEDGFSALSAYDTNNDGSINVNDAQFSDLLVWVDANSNGYSDSEELYSLSNLGISSITLNADLVNYEIEGNHITHESTFTINGQERLIVDAWFAFDNTNTRYAGDYTLDTTVLFLPTLRGFGNVKDLHIAMSMDESLLEMVSEFSGADTETLLSASFNVHGKIEQIMYLWAGVDAVNPTSRGQYIDARKLEFLEKFFGENFLQQETWVNPGSVPAALLNETFKKVFSVIATQLLLQSSGRVFFDGDAHYDHVLGDIEGGTAIDNLHILGSSAFVIPTNENDVYVVAENSNGSVYFESLTGGDDQIWIGAASTSDVRWWAESSGNLFFKYTNGATTQVQFSGTNINGDGLDIIDRIEKIVFSDGVNIDISNGLVLSDTDTAHSISGSYLADTIYGRGGNDTISGWDGDDILIGGAGADYLYGNEGDDTYSWNVGDGNDRIIEMDIGFDQIQLNGQITSQDIRLIRDGLDLKVYIGSEMLTVNQHFYDQQYAGGEQYKVEQIALHDQTVIDLLSDIVFTGTSANESLSGTKINDTLIGNGGNDNLFGSGGDDGLYGGYGNDALHGESGNDTYFWSIGDGNDTLNETSGVDHIVLGSGIDADDIRFFRNDLDLKIHVGSEVLTVKQQFYNDNYGSGGDGYQFEKLVLHDQTEIDLINNLVFTGSSSAEVVNGTKNADTLIGRGGIDTLYGGIGNDTYIWSIGDGNDTLNETSGVDHIVLGSGIDADDIRFFRNGLDLKVHVGSEVLTVKQQFYNDNYGSGGDGYQFEKLVLHDQTEIDLINNLVFTGSSSAEVVNGTKNADTLIGLGGNDTLYGSDGNDVLYGSAGADLLNGGAGADKFIFTADSAFAGVDTITDFNKTQNDKIDISDLLDLYDPLNDAITDFVRITQSGAHSILAVDVDGGANNFVHIATLSNTSGLTDEQDLMNSGHLLIAA